jgi:hypothetical protein
MATYTYDPSQQTTGSNPIGSGWTVRRASGISSSTIAETATPVGTKVWRILQNELTDSVVCLDSAGSSVGDTQILMLFRYSAPGTIKFHFFGPAYRVVDSSNYYIAGPRYNQQRDWIQRRLSNSPDALSDAAHTRTMVDTWWWIRGEAVGTTLRFRIWEDGAEEPTSWTRSTTDSNFASGHIGWAILANNDMDGMDLAWWSAGTGSDTAPEPSTGLAFTVAPTVTSRTTESYTIGGTTNQDCTVFAVATETTATDPDGPQIAAGTDGDDAAAPGTGSVAATADTAFSLNITGTFTESTHDIHIVARREA